MKQFNFTVENEGEPRKRFVWSCKGEKGGVHIWAQFTEEPICGEKCYGGIEVHYPFKPYDFAPDEPHHDKCWLLDGPCWHDGSSLYFSERIQPMVESYEDEPEKIIEFINAELHDWYVSKLDLSEGDTQ